MANETVEKAAVIQFSDSVHQLAQQMKARLRGWVKIKALTAEKFAYDRLGDVEAQEINGRHQPVQFADIEHSRRKIGRRRFSLYLPIDGSDVRSMLSDPQSEYAAACARAMERVFDRVVVEAQFAAVLTGKDMDTSVTYANDDGTTVNATAGLTYEKLLEIGQNFLDDEVGTEMAERVALLVSGDEHTALMKEQELVSGDFSRQYVIDKGRIAQAAGLDLILFGGSVSRPILPVSGGVRDCTAMSDRAMCVGLSKEMSISVDPRPDLTETKQVGIVFDLGAVRTEGKLIQKVQTTD